MGKVFFDMAMSLDGFIAGPKAGPDNPIGTGGPELSQWMYNQKAFLKRENGECEGEGDTQDNELIEATFNRIGANIMGKRMFDEGEINWPEEAPHHTPVFVLTHQARDPWKRKGGTTFYFTSDPIEDILKQAKEAAGGKDVRIAGGANLIQQYLKAGLVDEFTIHIAPFLLKKGVQLFENLEEGKIKIEAVEAIHSPVVTHLKYRVVK